MKNYNEIALLYAERYGVIDYEVIGNKMKYEKKYIVEGLIAKTTVNLDSMVETRQMVIIEEEK